MTSSSSTLLNRQFFTKYSAAHFAGSAENRRALEDTSEDNPTLQSEALWKQTLTVFVNYTFYMSANGVSSAVSGGQPNCTIDFPCVSTSEMMQALEQKMFLKANEYFLYMLSMRRYVVVNVVFLDDMTLECDSPKNVFLRPSIYNVMFMFRFTSQFERKTITCDRQGLLFESTRSDVFMILVANLNLKQVYVRNDYSLNFGIHHSSVFGSVIINFDVARSKNLIVEYCELEQSAIAYRKSEVALFLYSKFTYYNTISLYFANNIQMVGLQVSGILKTDFMNIVQMLLYRSKFKDHSILFFITNNVIVHIEECRFEDQTVNSVMFDVTKGESFRFFNSYAKGNIVIMDVKAQTTVGIINSTFIENRAPVVNSEKKFELYQAYNSPVNIRSSLMVDIETSLFDNNFGNKGAHLYLQDIIEVRLYASRFLNGNGSGIVIDTVPSSDLYRYSIIAQNSLFENNYSQDYGGALRILYSIQSQIVDCIFRNNVAVYSGGAINYVLANYMNLNGTIFERNRVLFAGATPDEEYFYRGAGGGIAVNLAAQPISFGGAQFIENEAYVGGALFFRHEGLASISNSIFRKNRAKHVGGAVFLFAPTNMTEPQFVNVVFDQNSAGVFGNNYLSSINVITKEETFLSIYPGQTIHMPMKTFTNEIPVPCDVDRYLVSSEDHPGLYFDVEEMKDGLNITMLVLNGTLADYVGLTFNTSIKVAQTFDKGWFSSFTVLPCPSRYEYKFNNYYGIAAYMCVTSNALTWKEIVAISVPAGFAFFVMGTFSGIFMLYMSMSILKRLRTLSSKEKAEKAVAQRILDKRIVFGSDYEPSKSNDTHYFDTLSAPLLASNEVELKISRKVRDFLIPIEAIEIVSKVAEGGQGIIYIALLYGKTKVAVKSLKKLMSDGNDVNDVDEEFEKEASILYSLKHKNILKFFGIALTEDSKYMITEYLENGSLERLIYKLRIGKATLKFKQKLLILQDICSGLEYLHALEPPIVHRDLKPGNVLFDLDYRCKICDFGLSRSVGNLNTNNTMTKNIGTFLYSSPESWTFSGDTGDSSQDKILKATKGDVYSFGIMMHELFFELSPYSQSSKIGGDSLDDHNMINILSHVAKGNRPLIPFNNLDQVREWLQLYPLQSYTLNTNLCQIVLDYFKLTTQCWDEKPEFRPTIKEVGDELKRLLFELSAHCE